MNKYNNYKNKLQINKIKNKLIIFNNKKLALIK